MWRLEFFASCTGETDMKALLVIVPVAFALSSCIQPAPRPVPHPRQSSRTVERYISLDPIDDHIPPSTTRWHTNVDADDDFTGHGPYVEARAELRVSTSGRAIEGRVYLMAYECCRNAKTRSVHPDGTGAEGWSEWVRIGRYSSSGKIVDILSSRKAHVKYLFPKSPKQREFRGRSRSCVDKFYIVGDVGGVDAGVATRVDVTFRDATILVKIDDDQ